jgi:S-DNA-T family DNA segregation ATPase FtsK/SpoIIIE
MHRKRLTWKDRRGREAPRRTGTAGLPAFRIWSRITMSEPRKIRNDIVAVGLLTVIVFLVAALGTYDPADPAHEASSVLCSIYQPDQLVYPNNPEFNNACGRWGAWTADMLLHVLGIGAYYLVIGLIAMEVALFRRQSLSAPWLKTIGWIVSLIGMTSLASMILPDQTIRPLIGAGGYLGALGNGLLAMQFGTAGSLIVSLSVFVVGMMMWTEYLIFRAGRIVFAPAFMAATSMLPFGLIHRFATWFNGTETDESEDTEELEPQLRFDGEHELDAPRTIRFRRRDVETDLEIEDEEEFDDDLDELEEYITDEDDDEYEAIEEEPATLKISSHVKTPDPVEDAEDEAAAVTPEPAAPIPKPHFKMPKKAKPDPEPSERDVVISQLNEAAEAETVADYDLPPLEILSTGDSVPFERQKREALQKAEILERTCKQFGYDVKVVEIETGPVISQYEIDLAPGLRLQKITALADDLAIAMRVPSVRIVAPIPGKNSVGVEVPNETRQIVSLRQVMEQSDKQIKKMKIPLFLGADAVGAPMVADLASLPHLLIAGRTGTGKSVALNAIISSILMTRKPDEVRMLMVDPKMVELSGYGRLPHLMHPVVTDMRKAEAILAWAVDKMEERYTLLAKAGVRHLTTYNQLDDEERLERINPQSDEEREAIPSSLPFIVIVADEMADLMMTAGKDVEQHIIRLAQKSRAVGIHLILATQKPTVDVITGLIKSNLPARIAFQVASKTDSRVVLDASGADKLLGMGDMLFLWPGTSTLLRGQGTYLSDEEIDAITEVVSTGEQNFVHELVNIKIVDEDEESDEPKQLENRDELYEEAITIVVREQRGSCSLLQRAMGIGYGRAARLIDFMAEDGYVGPYNGSKAREVLLTEAQWENIQAGDPNPVNDEDWPEDDDAVEPSQPLKAIEKQDGLATSLAASTAAAPKESAPPKIVSTTVTEDEFVSPDNEELEDEYEDAEDEDLEVEAAADNYEYDEDEEDYEYEDDEDYEDVEDEELD